MSENQINNESCYSCEDDDLCFRDLQNLINEHELTTGDMYTKYDLVQNPASYYFSIDDMIDRMGEQADEEVGEHACGFPDLSDDEKSELNTIISNWLDQRVIVDFFTAVNPQKCLITAEDMQTKTFPILKGKTIKQIPFDFIVQYKLQAKINHGQTIQRLAERGGLHSTEAIAIIESRKWVNMPEEIAEQQVKDAITKWKIETAQGR